MTVQPPLLPPEDVRWNILAVVGCERLKDNYLLSLINLFSD
jgi:hypothetical protein